MIAGIGIDIVRVDRIRKSYERFGDRFASKILSEAELQVFSGKKNKVAFLAKRFAAKEAASKALGTGMREGVHFTQIIIRKKSSGAPFLELEGAAKHIADELGISNMFLSISDEQDNAIAYVVFEKA